ncbi:glycosyltransferase family 2 protein [Massilia sp. Dwa41.01b]|uniref:glycosyltransferase family 2 protein n=1 Tax=Massilia sp. Dwa41.01b TaxID=2709302 RepID=UPI0015FF6556|nr:glycosyltransferase family 2 protein [Massilia sp. Dwa41.01b]QNA90326.1 glycosyltransferase family 2 protein [Massilia sp. Dwa41.01b]
MKYSVVIPVYRNAESIPRLVEALIGMNRALDGEMEAVFVVDGSPDQSFALLREHIERLDFPAQLLAHSRNFGSFPAIRTGLQAARGSFFGVMAADLQEPPELLVAFFRALAADECDVAIGTRNARNDPASSRLASSLFWGMYRKLVVPDMPPGGVDVFGCNTVFRDQLLALDESRSSLIALIFWLGFRRKLVGYERLVRQEGKSAWTLSKKIDYMMDSIFAFTDYPIRLLMRIGALGSAASLGVALMVAVARLVGAISVPGYAATMLAVLVLGALNLLGLDLVGTYAWRAYENSKQRPLAVVAMRVANRVG